MGMPTLSSPRVGCATSSQAGAVRPGRPDPTAACLRSRAPGEGSSPSPAPSSEALSGHAKAPPRAARHQLRRTRTAARVAAERLGAATGRILAMETPRGPKPPQGDTRAGGSAATPSHMRTRPRRQLAARPAMARHVAPGLGRWLIRLLELTIRLHEQACSAQAPRADPRTVAPHRPRGLLAPRGRMRSNARECR